MEVTYWATLAAVLTAVVAFLATGLRRRLDLVAVALWALVVAAGTLVTVVARRVTMDLDTFGAVNVAYRQVVIGLPLAAGLIAVRSWRRGWRDATAVVGRIVLLGALLLAPLGVWMSVVEPNRLIVREASMVVAAVPAGQQVRLGIISDLQMGDTGVGPHERAAVAALVAEHPDVILIAGDVVQSSRAAFDAHLSQLRALMSQLDAPGGTYIVEGDVDEEYELTRLTDGTGVRWLADEIVTTTVRGVPVSIGGIALDPDAQGARAVAEELESRPGTDDVRILLAHRPDAVLLLPAQGTRTDLVVAGHTHGGQVVVPFLGPVLTLTEVPRAVAAGGLHAMGDRTIYVTSGVGVERHQAPKIRLLCPPSVSVVTLTHS